MLMIENPYRTAPPNETPLFLPTCNICKSEISKEEGILFGQNHICKKHYWQMPLEGIAYVCTNCQKKIPDQEEPYELKHEHPAFDDVSCLCFECYSEMERNFDRKMEEEDSV